jgi:hypothetical protein
MIEEDRFFPQEPERDEWGMDLSLLRVTRAMSPEERVISHQNALDLVLELRDAGKNLGYWPQSASQDPL